jgi:hypothetical protein
LYYRDLIFDVNGDSIWSRRVTKSGTPSLVSILHSSNSSVSKSGQTLTVKINGVEQSLTNTTYSSLKNPNAIKFKKTDGTTVTYDGSSAADLTTGVNYATSAGNADTVDNLHATSFAIWRGDASTDSTATDTSSTSTADFFAKINATSGLFNSRFGAMRGSWWYDGNTQLDTGVGTLEMAGTAVLNLGSYADTNDTYKSLLFLDRGGRLWSYTANETAVKQWSRYVKTTDKIANASCADGAYYVFDYNATTTPIYIGFANTGLTSTTASYLAAYGTTSSGARCIKDISAAEAKKFIGLGNVQNTAFYQRATAVNGTTWNMAGTTNSAAFTIYAPTTAGTSG